MLLVFSNRQKSQKFQQIVMAFLIGLFSFIFDSKNISSHANMWQIWTCKFWGSQQHCWGFRSLGMWHCIVGSLVPKVMEEHSAFILRTKQSKKNMDCWTLNIKGTIILWNFGNKWPDNAVSHSRRPEFYIFINMHHLHVTPNMFFK